MKTLTALIALGIATGSFAAAAAEKPVAIRLEGISLNASDLAKTTAFYKMIGLEEGDLRGEAGKRTQYMNMNVTKNQFDKPGLVLRETKDPITLGNATNVLIFVVADAKGVCQKLADAKMPCDREPKVEGPNKSMAGFTKDPDGRTVEFLQLTGQ
jgi:hypothetical protein